MWHLILFAASLFVVATPASAREPLAIVELRFAGVPDAFAAQIRARLERSLSEVGYAVLPEQEASRQLADAGIPPGCTVGPCLHQVERTLKVQRILVGGVSSQGTSQDITLTMLETGSGTALAQVNQRCDVCTFKDFEGAVARAAVELHRQAQVYLATQARLEIRSVPPQADILLDGLLVGKTPFGRWLAPGQHKLEVAATGYTSQARQVVLRPGKSHALQLNLVPKAAFASVPTKPLHPRSSAPSWVKWTVLGAGLAIGGLGGGLLALDEHQDGEAGTAAVTVLSLGAASAIAGGLMALFESLGSPASH